MINRSGARDHTITNDLLTSEFSVESEANMHAQPRYNRVIHDREIMKKNSVLRFVQEELFEYEDVEKSNNGFLCCLEK